MQGQFERQSQLRTIECELTYGAGSFMATVNDQDVQKNFEHHRSHPSNKCSVGQADPVDDKQD